MMFLPIVFAAALAAAPDGLIRHYLFDEGIGDEVVNHAVFAPGKRSITGGPLGSMEIIHRTHYGTGSVEAYYERDKYVESSWCAGRYPGKSALRVGTRPIGLFRSGITGKEFEGGMTFAGWIKFESRGKSGSVHAEPFRLPDGYGGNGFSIVWSEAQWAPAGLMTARIGCPKSDEYKNGVVELSVEGCASDVWHYFALTLDGSVARLILDDKAVEKPFKGKISSVYKDGAWSGQRPFIGTARVPCLHIGNIRDMRSRPNPFVIDELAIFDRALEPEAIRSFLTAKPAAGTLDEQRSATLAERERRKELAAISFGIPEDSHGYFRVGAGIPVSVKGVKGGKLRIHAETTYGQKIFDRDVALNGVDGEVATISFDKCDAYIVDLTLLGTDGKVVKRLMRPYIIGIVPKAPDHLNSPFGFWACTDAFSYDSNLRRVAMGWFKEGYGPLPANRLDWSGYREVTNCYNLYTAKQHIPKEDLRIYAFLPHLGSKTGKLPEDAKAEYLKAFEWSALTAKEFGIKEFEVTSEVDGRTTPEAYMWNLENIWNALQKEIPDAVCYPPGATPCALPFINKILELGAWKYSAGVSHHNYLSTPVHNFYWDNPGKRLKEIVDVHAKAHGRKLSLFNTESGIFSLPYVHNRPMTREHARAAGYSISQIGGYETYNTSMPTLPDDEAAAVQAHAIFVNLCSGYEMYVKCQTPCLGTANPCRQGVALTALSGQVLNDMSSIEALPMSSLKTMAVLVKRTHKKTGVKSNVFTVFGMENRRFTFKVDANKTYRTMDLLGNFGSVTSDANGVLTVDAKLDPQYFFDVPESIVELTPMKISVPAILPESGRMEGSVILENPFGQPIKGRLLVEKIRGATVSYDESEKVLRPGAKLEVPFALVATGLKRRNYPLRFTFGALAAEAVFKSKGLVYTVPRVEKPLALDGNLAKWEGVPEMVCDTEDDVVHGKPNFAELWLPQWGNAQDLSVKVRTCYVRDDALYFRLDVTDQFVMTAPPEANGLAFRYDCLEFFIDTRTGKALGSPVDFGADQVIIPAVDAKKLEKSPLWCVKREKAHVSVETVGRRTKNGWMLEGRVVPKAECAMRLRPGSQFMMDFVVDDCDGAKLMRKAAMAVHGDFNNNSNVSGWGRYELGL